MATQRQIAANRRNARNSTGPVTAEGKSASAGNASTHGLFSAVLKLNGADDRERYEQLHASFTRRFRPADELERMLLDRLVVAAWKLRKALEAEGNLLLDTPWNCYPRNLAGSHAVLRDREEIKWLRYDQHFERAMYRALKELRELQSLRQHDPDLGLDEDEDLKVHANADVAPAPAQNEPNIVVSADATSASAPPEPAPPDPEPDPVEESDEPNAIESPTISPPAVDASAKAHVSDVGTDAVCKNEPNSDSRPGELSPDEQRRRKNEPNSAPEPRRAPGSTVT